MWGSRTHPALTANLSTETSALLQLQGAALEADTSYTLTVHGTTFLGAITDIVVHTLTIRSSPPPLLAINMPASPYLRTATTWINALATYSACAADKGKLTYTWEVSLGTAYSEADVILSGYSKSCTLNPKP